MRTVDRIFGWLLIAFSLVLAGFLHHDSSRDAALLILFPLLCSLMLGSMNLMRAERPHDRTLARTCVAGNAVFTILMVAMAFTKEQHTVPWAGAVLCSVLLALSMRTRRRSRPM